MGYLFQTALVSFDGRSWHLAQSNTNVLSTVEDVTWDGRNFIAVGRNGWVYTSPDGEAWLVNSVSSGPANRSVAGSPTLALCSREGGTVAASSNYFDWYPVWTNKVVRLGGTNDVTLLDGVYANGRFVFVGFLGSVCVSSNGTDWVSGIAKEDWDLYEVAAAGDYFVAGGIGGLIFTSTNGLDWQEHILPGPAPISGLAYGLDTVVVTASYGSIFQSDTLSQSTRTIRDFDASNPASIVLRLLATPGTAFDLQSSADLKTWSSQSLFAPTGRLRYQETRGPGPRFFRAIPH
jgi:hypothetical protein